MTLFILLLTSCYDHGPMHHMDRDDDVSCTEEARSSVSLTVTDPSGVALSDATAAYTVDGRQSAPCESWGDGSLVCGWEVEGAFVITVSAEGYVDEVIEATVNANRCHVLGEVVTVVLQPDDSVDCTEEVRPSVVGTLESATGAPLAGAAVTWSFVDGEMATQPCTLEGNTFACGQEAAGILEITATATGHYPDVDLVEVSLTDDGCHVETEETAFVLYPL